MLKFREVRVEKILIIDKQHDFIYMFLETYVWDYPEYNQVEEESQENIGVESIKLSELIKELLRVNGHLHDNQWAKSVWPKLCRGKA